MHHSGAEHVCMQCSTVSGSVLVIDTIYVLMTDKNYNNYKPVIPVHNSGNNRHYRPWESPVTLEQSRAVPSTVAQATQLSHGL